MADELEASGDVEHFVDAWLRGPMFARLVRGCGSRARRSDCRNTASGLASSLRLCGTGTQEPLWDRLPTLASAVLALAGIGRHPLRRARAPGGPPRAARRGVAGPGWRSRRPPGPARAGRPDRASLARRGSSRPHLTGCRGRPHSSSPIVRRAPARIWRRAVVPEHREQGPSLFVAEGQAERGDGERRRRRGPAATRAGSRRGPRWRAPRQSR